MDNNTHGAFMEFPDGSRAFVDGIPDKCDHDSDGSGYHMVSYMNGGGFDEYIPVKDETIEELMKLDEELRKQGKYLSGGCVSCSKCGKPFTPPMF